MLHIQNKLQYFSSSDLFRTIFFTLYLFPVTMTHQVLTLQVFTLGSQLQRSLDQFGNIASFRFLVSLRRCTFLHIA